MMIILTAATLDAGASWLAEIAGLRGLWIGLNLIGLTIFILRYTPQNPIDP